jgi:ribokinase
MSLIVFGSINLDLVFQLPALPQPGQTRLALTLSLEPGGKGANQAVAAALDGARVHMVGAVGQDAFADTALSGLGRAGVDLTGVVRTAATTGIASISVDHHGQNQIIVSPGANLEARADQVQDAHLGPRAVVLAQMEMSVAETSALVRRARSRGARVLLNLAPAAAIAPEVLGLLDLLIVNEDETLWLAEHLGIESRAAALQEALGCGVIRTLGADGAEVATARERWRTPAPRVEVVDSTGAGDCLAGVLAAALDAGRPLRESVERAVAAASLCCTRLGSQRSLPSASEIDAVA